MQKTLLLGISKWAVIGSIIVAASGLVSWATASGVNALTGVKIGVATQRQAIAKNTLYTVSALIIIGFAARSVAKPWKL